MTKIEAVDADAGTAIVQAGVILQTLQDEVEKEGLTFPLDLGGRGSCTIGGNIATNAGGNRVIRYGMTRDLVVGLEVVLADGMVLDSLRTVTKNNTGPDLKQLFIGSEGILGVVTRAVVRLVPKPTDRIVALCAADDFSQVRALLRHCRARLGSDLTAFEVMWRSYYARAVGLVGSAPPAAIDHAYYILIEASGMDFSLLHAAFELALSEASDNGLIPEAVIARSGADNDRLWRVRDLAIETSRLIAPLVPFDVSVGIRDMEGFVNDINKAVLDLDPRCEMLVFGHIGDGNLHFAIHNPPDRQLFERIEHAVYQCVGDYRGSVSAEHGIGWLKRDFLKYTRSPDEIQTMKMLKMTLDPKRILNRNRVLAN
jgi:FAD/FMN-containing dehydrogenase